MNKNVLEYNKMNKKPVNSKMFDIPLEEKLGRNDECWCGSGKKYKHCCGK